MKYILLLICFFISPVVWADELPEKRVLIIQTDLGEHYFETDIADTPQLQERGLMYKKNIPMNYAMTFLFEKPKIIRMWMKNTYIPLDMIFFDEKGIIVSLKENAAPHDLIHISSKRNALGVVELNAGLIQKKKIRIGDKIILN